MTEEVEENGLGWRLEFQPHLGGDKLGAPSRNEREQKVTIGNAGQQDI